MVNLTPEQARRRRELTDKLTARTLTANEARELQQLLEIERAQATSVGDVIAALAVLFLIGLVIAYLADDR